MDTQWRKQWRRWYGLLAIVLVIGPMLMVAQGQAREAWEGHARGWPRGEIQIANDWQDEVKVTIWSHRREQIGAWIIKPGDQAMLQIDGERIKVRPGYKIKVGDDWGWVDVGDVGQFQHGVWYANVRTIWRATHGARPGVPNWEG